MKRTEKNTQWHMRVILLLAGDIIEYLPRALAIGEEESEL